MPDMTGESKQEQAAGDRYAWEWFALHSGQRLQLVNFWLVAVSFLSAAFVQAVMADLQFVAVGVGLVGAIASLAFYRLDARTRQLIQVGEKALGHFERLRRSAGEDPIASLVSQANTDRRPIDSYRIIIQGLQIIMATLFLLASVYALLR